MSSKPTITTDELHDRITDQALSELLGEQSPPDLTERIMTAAKTDLMVLPAADDKNVSSRLSTWKSNILAASVLLVIGAAAIYALNAQTPRKVYRATAWLRVEPNNYIVFADTSPSSEPEDFLTGILNPRTLGRGIHNYHDARRSDRDLESVDEVVFAAQQRALRESENIPEPPPEIIDYRTYDMGHRAGNEVVVTGTKRLHGKWDRLLQPSDVQVLTSTGNSSGQEAAVSGTWLSGTTGDKNLEALKEKLASKENTLRAIEGRIMGMRTELRSPARITLIRPAKAPERRVDSVVSKPSGEHPETLQEAKSFRELKGNTRLLEQILQEPAISNDPAVQSQENPLDWLADNLHIAKDSDRELMTVSFECQDSELSARVTNAFVSVFFKHQSRDDAVKMRRVVELLEDEKARRKAEIEHLRNQVGEDPTGDKYEKIYENPFLTALKNPLSTFSIDVDTASYANVRRFLLDEHSLPPAAAVRIEELVNYFDYDYAPPRGEHPFASHVEVAGCPWQPEHRLVRVALKGKEIDQKERPESNLVFLLDVSGSMSSQDKLPLLKQGMQMLVRQLGENDRVAIVVYAGSEGLALPSTRGHHQQEILAALEKLDSGGSTNGGAGISLAYKIAQENYIEGGANRVILCTDGDFNVGTTGTEELKKLVAERAKNGVFLSVLGFGRGNLNDEMMESISNRGNGNYSYIDNLTEARKVLVSQMSGTLVTIAKDVKIQIEFNPAQVQAYRLIGYENRIMAAKDFNDDKKDAGEIGAGHTVTALYEIVPVGRVAKGRIVEEGTDPLKYQPQPKQKKPTSEKSSDKLSKELLTLKLRYKQPEGSKSKLLEVPVTDTRGSFARSSKDFQFAAAVASFGMLLRGSKYRGGSSYSAIEEIASAASGKDPHGYRAEFLDMVRRAKSLER